MNKVNAQRRRTAIITQGAEQVIIAEQQESGEPKVTMVAVTKLEKE